MPAQAEKFNPTQVASGFKAVLTGLFRRPDGRWYLAVEFDGAATLPDGREVRSDRTLMVPAYQVGRRPRRTA